MPPIVFLICMFLGLFIKGSAFGLAEIWTSARVLTTMQRPIINRQFVDIKQQRHCVMLMECMPSFSWKQKRSFRMTSESFTFTMSRASTPRCLQLKSSMTVGSTILRMMEKKGAHILDLGERAARSLFANYCVVRPRSTRMYMMAQAIGSESNPESESYFRIGASADAHLENELFTASEEGSSSVWENCIAKETAKTNKSDDANATKKANKDIKIGKLTRKRNIKLQRFEESSEGDLTYQSKQSKRWKVVKSALLVYKQLYGNLKVPRGFIIPHSDKNWPTELEGEGLGSIVYGIRRSGYFAQYRAELKEMGIKFVLRRVKITWPTVRFALETYMQLHGDSRIPGDFIVPDESSDWPEELWDMELGKVVSRMRYDDKYFKEHRPEMDAMGFDLDPQLPRGLLDWPQVKLALETYKKLHDDLLVEKIFVVPGRSSNWPEELWGMSLGKTVDNIRKHGEYEDYRGELKAMGFDFRPQRNKNDWDRVKLSFEVYNRIYGDFVVPFFYVVPFDDIEWPEKLWGMKLGNIAGRIRRYEMFANRRAELEAMGFDYSSKMEVYGWGKIKVALEIYNKLYGNLVVPGLFFVPTNDSSWPEELWGVKLGGIVNAIRGNRLYKRQRKELVAMGFDFSSQSNDYGWDNVKLALEIYKSLYDNLHVLGKFIVPAKDNAWPKELWGMKLGNIVCSIRGNRCYASHRKELVAMGYDFRNGHSWEPLKLALEIYKRIWGDLQVPRSFIVPSSDDWPEKLWGMNLGTSLNSIRCYGTFAAYTDELVAMGFEFDPKRKTFDRQKLALVTYKRLYNTFRVPRSFVVPENDTAWPEETWGMKLGNTAHTFRYDYCNGSIEYREELIAIGFEFRS